MTDVYELATRLAALLGQDLDDVACWPMGWISLDLSQATRLVEMAERGRESREEER